MKITWPFQRENMNGKKFVILFLGLTVVSGVLVSLWIKQGYDSRPQIKIEDEKK